MINEIFRRGLGKWLIVAALLSFGLAMAQAEPTINQIYQEAQSGRLEQAQVMMQQVLVAHPDSAKAHFVHAELLARQGKLGPAREALARAERIAPGLPFAKAGAVQALRAQLAGRTAVRNQGSAGRMPMMTGAPEAAERSSSFPWGLALLLGGAAIALVIYMLRSKPAQSFGPAGNYPNQGALNGPQGFGMGNTMGGPGMGPSYGPPGAAGSGLGGQVMGGLATGLAVGAGVIAAQVIGRSLTGHGDGGQAWPDRSAGNDYASPSPNTDMGGQNFGLADTSSWDDGGGSGDVGGGDWDN